MMTNIVAIVPARGGSTGIPKKNLKEIGGDPLVGIAVSQAVQSTEITLTVASSDNSEIRAAAEEYGANRVVERPERFAKEDKMMGVDRFLKWQVTQLEEQGVGIDVVVLLYPTSPLRSVETIDETIRKVTEDGCDSALTLYDDDRYLWETDDKTATPTNYDPKKRGPRQLEEWNQWAENKAVYAMDRDRLVETGVPSGRNYRLRRNVRTAIYRHRYPSRPPACTSARRSRWDKLVAICGHSFRRNGADSVVTHI